MSQELSFETIPFEIAPEFQGEMFEEEGERGGRRPSAGGGSRYSRPRSQPGLRPKGTKRPPIPKPRPIPRGARRSWEVIREPYGLVSEPHPGEPEPSDSERVRWIQDCLNQAMGLQLPVTGIMGAETRSAVRSFQKQQGLRVSGIVSPKTEQALNSACEGGQASRGPSEELEDYWEVLESNGELEQEFVLEKPCSVNYAYQRTSQNERLTNIPILERIKEELVVNPKLPKTRGVYVIKIGKTPHYVGVATSSDGVKKRFNERVKALRDLGIDLSKLLNIYVDVFTVTGGSPCEVNRRPKGKKDSPITGSRVRSNADLLLLEQFLITKLGTRSRGNKSSEDVVRRNSQDTANTVTFTGTFGVGTLP